MNFVFPEEEVPKENYDDDGAKEDNSRPTNWLFYLDYLFLNTSLSVFYRRKIELFNTI